MLAKNIGQYFVFLTGSGLGAVIDYFLTLGLVYGAGFDVKLGLAISMCVSAVAVFLFHNKITFGGTQQRSFWEKLLRFLVLAFAIYGLRALILWVSEGWLPIPIQLAMALGIVSVLNFALSKLLVFR
jgi:putative flippase GtrA